MRTAAYSRGQFTLLSLLIESFERMTRGEVRYFAETRLTNILYAPGTPAGSCRNQA
jgi:hypothetical protein